MISVIIPVYNVEEYLHVCINSVLMQTYSDFEIICIDDASTDSSIEILNYFSNKDSRVKVIRNEKNSGMGHSRNIGMDAAEGKYILFLDSDDWLSLNALEKLVEKSEEANLDVLMFKAIAYYQNNENFGMREYFDMEIMEKYDNKIFNHWDLDKTQFFKIPIVVWNKLYLKSFLDENRIRFCDENYIQEDNPFSCEVLINAQRISFINEYFYNRRRRPNSVMTLNNERLLDNIHISYLILDVFLKDKKIYEYYKKEVLTFIFKSALSVKYQQIEDKYKEEFFKQAQGVIRDFIIKYKLYNDICENVPQRFLDLFKFDEIMQELL